VETSKSKTGQLQTVLDSLRGCKAGSRSGALDDPVGLAHFALRASNTNSKTTPMSPTNIVDGFEDDIGLIATGNGNVENISAVLIAVLSFRVNAGCVI